MDMYRLGAQVAETPWMLMLLYLRGLAVAPRGSVCGGHRSGVAFGA